MWNDYKKTLAPRYSVPNPNLINKDSVLNIFQDIQCSQKELRFNKNKLYLSYQLLSETKSCLFQVHATNALAGSYVWNREFCVENKKKS